MAQQAAAPQPLTRARAPPAGAASSLRLAVRASLDWPREHAVRPVVVQRFSAIFSDF